MGPLLPVFHRPDQTIQRGDAQHDHEIAAHLGVTQLEPRVHHQRVLHAFLIDAQRLENGAEAYSRLSCGTENVTWTLSRLPNVPRQALSRMFPTSVRTSRAEASIEQRERRLVGQQLLQYARPGLIEDQQRVAGDRSAEDLVHARHIGLDDLAPNDADSSSIG